MNHPTSVHLNLDLNNYICNVIMSLVNKFTLEGSMKDISWGGGHYVTKKNTVLVIKKYYTKDVKYIIY